MADNFKPNIYPIIYWGLMYGLIAGFVLIVINFIADYIGFVWVPVFLGGLMWGSFRNYKKQRAQAGVGAVHQTPVEEFRDAAKDIVSATRDLIADQRSDALDEITAAPEERPVDLPEVPVTEAPGTTSTTAASEEETPPTQPTPPG